MNNKNQSLVNTAESVDIVVHKNIYSSSYNNQGNIIFLAYCSNILFVPVEWETR